jgi:hypothetical protein
MYNMLAQETIQQYLIVLYRKPRTEGDGKHLLDFGSTTPSSLTPTAAPFESTTLSSLSSAAAAASSTKACVKG